MYDAQDQHETVCRIIGISSRLSSVFKSTYFNTGMERVGTSNKICTKMGYDLRSLWKSESGYKCQIIILFVYKKTLFYNKNKWNYTPGN